MSAPVPSSGTNAASAPIPSTRRIAGFTGWNLFGLCAPMLVAFFSIPLFLSGLGKEQFGALMLIWMLVGYFSMLDLGMGRAMTKLTAEALSTGRGHLLADIFWTALAMMTALGLCGAVTLASASHWLATQRLHIPLELQGEACVSFWVVACALPFTVAVTGLIGVLETHQRFRLINLIRVPIGIATYLAPLAVLPFSHSLVAVVSVLIVVRLVELLVFLICCLVLIPPLRRVRWNTAMVKPLLTFGGWLTVSNVTLPVMIHIDRFIVGAVKALATVTYYAVPSEIVVKMLILPRAFVSALFPPMTMHLAQKSPEADALFARALKLLLLVLYPATLALVAVAPDFLRWWVGVEVAGPATGILRLLSAGIFVYSLSYLAFSLLQSAGRPGLAARWHLLELLPFLVVATWATRHWGSTGMAVVWGVRGLLDVLVLFPMALRFVPAARGAVCRTALLAALGLGLLAPLCAIESWIFRLPAAIAILFLFTAIAWMLLLLPAERAWVLSLLPRRRTAVPVPPSSTP